MRGDGSEAAGSFVADLVDELARQVEVRVVAPGPRQAREPWSARTEVFRYAAPTRPLSTLKPWRLDDLRWIRRVWLGGLRATSAAIAERDTDLLALWGLPCGEWVRRATRERGNSYSVWLLGSDVWSLGRLPVARQMLARVIRQAKHAYADGYKLAEEAQAIAGVPVAFLPSTRRIDLVDPLPPRREPPYRLLFLGRWHPNKGVDLLLDALTMLDDSDWEHIECVEIQGGGPLEPLVRQRVAVLREAGRPVKLGRFLTKPEAEAAIARADWVLIPSRIESIPVIFSDAMKLCRPVIAMPVGDLPRLMQETPCGILATTVTNEGLANTLRRATQTSATRFTSGIVSQATRFDLATITAKIREGTSSLGADQAGSD